MNIAIIGLGLIGGSMALAVKEHTRHHVLGWDISAATLDEALRTGAVDEALAGDFSRCDMVLVALYPGDTVDFLEKHAALFPSGCLVIDLCGVKRLVCDRAETLFAGTEVTFIGGHPMAGREVSGFTHATGDLFRNASMILTPGGRTPKDKLEMAQAFFLELGFGRIQLSTPEHHDHVIAFTSQLAHVLSSSYAQCPAAKGFMGFSAGSFQDLTRVARMNETMWSELFLQNSDCLTEQIDHIMENLMIFRAAISGKDRPALTRMIHEGTVLKERLDDEKAKEESNL